MSINIRLEILLGFLWWYAFPAAIGYGIGFLLVNPDKHRRERSDWILSFSLGLMFIGVNMLFSSYPTLRRGPTPIFWGAIAVLISAVITGITGILAKRNQHQSSGP